MHTLETGAQGPVVLSDLSAATWYGDKAATEQMEKLEVRAFGILLEELVARYDQRVSEFDQVHLIHTPTVCANRFKSHQTVLECRGNTENWM